MKKIAIPCLALVAAFALAGTSVAQNPPPSYVVFRLHNSTKEPVNVSVAWGGEGWQGYTLAPGQTLPFARRIVPGQPGPTVLMTFWDSKHGAWVPAFKPQVTVGGDPTGGFTGNFVLVGADWHLSLGWSS